MPILSVFHNRVTMLGFPTSIQGDLPIFASSDCYDDSLANSNVKASKSDQHYAFDFSGLKSGY